MDLEAKVELYGVLVGALSKAVKLEATLRTKGDDTGTAQAAAKADELAESIKRIRLSINEDWKGQAAAATRKARTLNTSLREEVSAIKRVIDHSDRLVKAIGYLDDLIKLAAGLLA